MRGGVAVPGGAGQPSARSDAPEGWADWLDPDERVLWQGAPSGRLRFLRGDVFLALFGCIWIMFALLFTIVSAIAAVGHASGSESVTVHGDFPGAIYMFPALGLAFVAAGFLQTFGPVIWDAWRRRRTRYAQTDRRALVVCSLPRRSIESFPIHAGSWLEYAPGPEASIHFSREQAFFRFDPRHVVKRGFELIPDGDAVYRLVRDIQRQDAERLR